MDNLSLFTLFDSVVIYEDETALLRLLERLEAGRSLDDVPNLIYRDDQRIHIAGQMHVEDVRSLPTPNFEGLPLPLYLSPERILPTYLSRGCYWRRCAFCTSPQGQDRIYRMRTAAQVTEDMRVLSRAYQPAFFALVDEAVPPRILDNLAENILQSRLAVAWLVISRPERGVDRPLCQKLSRAGCRVILYGLESACDRVLATMDKGSTAEIAHGVLVASSQAGMLNHVCLLLGFPTETLAEALQTARFALDHAGHIHSVALSLFDLDRHSRVMENPALYGIQPRPRDG